MTVGCVSKFSMPWGAINRREDPTDAPEIGLIPESVRAAFRAAEF
jgi:hypothetical protein